MFCKIVRLILIINIFFNLEIFSQNNKDSSRSNILLSRIKKFISLLYQSDISKVNLKSVVRIQCNSQSYNYQYPWKVGVFKEGSGTGFLIGENKFLTNAHVVSNSNLIYIKVISEPKPYKAKVLHIAHDCDLAILELENKSDFKNIFSDTEYLRIGDIPDLNTTVIVAGYPVGGERISVTKGIVSRIDFNNYVHSGIDQHLTIQIDAAINPGNSGGPVIQNNKVVGVAFQGLSGVQNTGYIIPTPVIVRFLEDVKDGKYDFYPDLATFFGTLLNPAQRIALGLKDDNVGVVVIHADSTGSASGILKKNDIMISIDGHTIRSDGFVNINGNSVNLNEIIERKFVSDLVNVEVLRNKELKSFDIKLKRFVPYLIQGNKYDEKPSFVIFNGLQFQPLDKSLVSSYSLSNFYSLYFYKFFVDKELYKDRPEPVILTNIIPHSSNLYLSKFRYNMVDTINDKKINKLQDVYDAFHKGYFEKENEKFHVIKLLNESRPLILDREKAYKDHKEIMNNYRIKIDNFIKTPDILKVIK